LTTTTATTTSIIIAAKIRTEICGSSAPVSFVFRLERKGADGGKKQNNTKRKKNNMKGNRWSAYLGFAVFSAIPSLRPSFTFCLQDSTIFGCTDSKKKVVGVRMKKNVLFLILVADSFF